jgi:hypothetical protein
MRKFLICAIGGLVAVLASQGPAAAHHSGAMFDREKTITISGTVKEFEYTNPHSWLQVMAADAAGKPVQWGFESEGPSTLLRSGIKRTTFMPGDKVQVKTHPLKDGRPGGSLMSVTKADGSVFGLGVSKPAAPAP